MVKSKGSGQIPKSKVGKFRSKGKSKRHLNLKVKQNLRLNQNRH